MINVYIYINMCIYIYISTNIWVPLPGDSFVDLPDKSPGGIIQAASPVVVHVVDGGVCTQQPHPPNHGVGSKHNHDHTRVSMEVTLPETNIAPENGWLEY